MASDSGPVRNVIRAQTGVQDSLLHNPSQSPFAYQAPMTCCNFVVSEILYRPQNANYMAGQKYLFTLDKQGDLLGSIDLVTVYKPRAQPATPGVGTNVTAVRYINNLGIGQIDYATIRYGANILCRCLPEWLNIRYRTYLNQEAKAIWGALSRMDQSDLQRDQFTASGGEVITNLCVPWGDDTSQYFSMCGMADALVIEVAIKPYNNLLNWVVNDNSNADTRLFGSDTQQILDDIYLRCDIPQLTGAERDVVVANVKSPNGQAKLIEEPQAHIRTLIPVNGAGFTYRLKMTNINAPVRSLFWYLEDPLNTAGTQVDTVNGGDWPHHPHPGLWAQWTYYSVVSGGNTIIPRTSRLRTLRNWVRWFSAPYDGENPIAPYSFSLNPEMTNASYGTLNFGQLDYPEIVIEFPNGLNNNYDPDHTGTSQGAYLNVVADTCNFFHEQGGDIVKTFG